MTKELKQKIKPVQGTERNYANKPCTFSVKQLKDFLDQYDDKLPVVMDNRHGSWFINSAIINEGWLHLRDDY